MEENKKITQEEYEAAQFVVAKYESQFNRSLSASVKFKAEVDLYVELPHAKDQTFEEIKAALRDYDYNVIERDVRLGEITEIILNGEVLDVNTGERIG